MKKWLITLEIHFGTFTVQIEALTEKEAFELACSKVATQLIESAELKHAELINQ